MIPRPLRAGGYGAKGLLPVQCVVFQFIRGKPIPDDAIILPDSCVRVNKKALGNEKQESLW